ncbi:MAG: type II toxin-antitoxin system RelE/ParE family toxin [Planctomycetaceae bacterium]
MTLPVELHPEAIVESRASRLWYSERSSKLADEFLDELDIGIAQIGQFPTRWPTFLHGTRHYLMRRFPYVIVYRIREESIQIIAVAHCNREPGYWSARLRRD